MISVLSKLVVIVVWFLLVAPNAWGQTTSGTLRSNEIWNGVIDLTGNVTVPLGVTLTIQPGTTVQSSNTSERALRIYGTLLANGEVNNRILLQGVKTTIYSDSSGSSFSHVNFIKASTALTLNSEATLNQLMFANNSTALSNTYTNVAIFNSHFTRNSVAILLDGTATTVAIQNSLFSFNDLYAIQHNSTSGDHDLKVQNNTFIANRQGVLWYDYNGGSLTIKDNIFAHGNGGISCRSPSTFKTLNTSLGNNAFWKNESNYSSSSSYQGCLSENSDLELDPIFTNSSLDKAVVNQSTINEAWTLDTTSSLLSVSSTFGQIGAYGNNGSPPSYTIQFNASNQTFSGSITENEIWSGDIDLTGNVTVAQGVILKLLPGTKIQTPQNANINVFGRIWVLGTLTNPIRFQKFDNQFEWYGITISGLGNHIFQNATLSGVNPSHENISTTNHLDLLIEQSHFEGGERGIYQEKGENLIVNQSVFQNISYQGVYTKSNSATITNTQFIKTGIAVESSSVVVEGKGFVITNNQFFGNSFAGINVGTETEANGTILNNTFSRNKHGIYVSNSNKTITIKNNVLSFHKENGIYNNQNNDLTISQNTFIANPTNLYWNTTAGGTLTLTNNIIVHGDIGIKCHNPNDSNNWAVTLSHNAFWKNYENYSTDNSYQACLSSETDLYVDPKFVGSSFDSTVLEQSTITEAWQLHDDSPLLVASNTSGELGAYGDNGNPTSYTVDFSATNATVSGTLATNETWSGEITLTDNITVDHGVVLRISEGATIKIPENKRITVDGRIWVLGTSENKVSFQSTEEQKNWYGITINGLGNHIFRKVELLDIASNYTRLYSPSKGSLEVEASQFEGGWHGIDHAGYLTVRESKFSSGSGSGIRFVGRDLTVVDSIFDGNEDHGIYFSGHDLTVSNGKFNSAGEHGISFSGNHLKVTQSTFQSMAKRGISFNGKNLNAIENAFLRNQESGIYISNRSQGEVLIQNNTFTRSPYGLDIAGENKTITLKNNLFSFHTDYGIYNRYYQNTLTIDQNTFVADATSFYWNTDHGGTITLTNNIFAHSRLGVSCYNPSSGKTLDTTIGHNAFWRVSSPYSTNSSRQACQFAESALEADPLFIGSSFNHDSLQEETIVETWKLGPMSPLLTASQHGGQLGAYGENGSPPEYSFAFPNINSTTSGTILENEVWSGEITLTNNVTVGNGMILKILPGTIVNLPSNKSIYAYGRVWALGDTENRISIKNTEDGNRWPGIDLYGLGNHVFQSVDFTGFTDAAIEVKSDLKLEVLNSTFTQGRWGIYTTGRTNLFISQNRFQEISTADIYADGGWGHITKNIFDRGSKAVHLVNSRQMEELQIQDNIFQFHTYGVYVEGENKVLSLENNQFLFQGINGIYNSQKNQLTVNQNTFVGSESSGIYWNSSYGGFLKAQNNLFALISSGIYCLEHEAFENVLSHNAFWKNGVAYPANSGWKGCQVSPTDQKVNPHFKDPYRDWSLLPSSPLLNASREGGALGAFPDKDVLAKTTWTFSQNATTAGTLSQNEEWSGTIVLTDSVFIPQGIILKILPGTIVQAPNNEYINVNGILWALGTEESPVTFQAIENNIWSGITIDNGWGALEHSIIEKASTGVTTYNRLDLHNSVIRNNTIGVRTQGGSWWIENNQFLNNGTGLYSNNGSGGEERQVFYNLFRNNSSNGANLSGLKTEFSYNTLVNNSKGIYWNDASIIQNNILVDNQKGLECGSSVKNQGGVLRHNVLWSLETDYVTAWYCPEHSTNQSTPIYFTDDQFHVDLSSPNLNEAYLENPHWLNSDGTSIGIGMHAGKEGKNRLIPPFYTKWVFAEETIDLTPANPLGGVTYEFLENASSGTISNQGVYTAGETIGEYDTIRISDEVGSQSTVISIFVVGTTNTLRLATELSFAEPQKSYSLQVSNAIGPLIWHLQQNQSGGFLTQNGLYVPGSLVGGTDIIEVWDTGGSQRGVFPIAVRWAEDASPSTIPLEWTLTTQVPQTQKALLSATWYSNRTGESYYYVIDSLPNTIPNQNDSFLPGNRLVKTFDQPGVYYLHTRAFHNGALEAATKTTHQKLEITTSLQIHPPQFILVSEDDQIPVNAYLSIATADHEFAYRRTIVPDSIVVNNPSIAQLEATHLQGLNTGNTFLTVTWQELDSSATIHSYVRDRREIEPNDIVDLGNTNDPIDDSTKLNFDQTREGYLSSDEDVDWYSFTIKDESDFLLSFLAFSTTAEARLTFYNHNLQEILGGFDSINGSDMEFPVHLVPGKYYIKLEIPNGQNVDQHSPYELTLTPSQGTNFPKLSSSYAGESQTYQNTRPYDSSLRQYVYPNDLNERTVLDYGDALFLELSFDSSTSFELDRDYLIIENEVGQEIGRFTGKELRSQKLRIWGGKVALVLITDGQGKDYGYYVSVVPIYGQVNSMEVDTPHDGYISTFSNGDNRQGVFYLLDLHFDQTIDWQVLLRSGTSPLETEIFQIDDNQFLHSLQIFQTALPQNTRSLPLKKGTYLVNLNTISMRNPKLFRKLPDFQNQLPLYTLQALSDGTSMQTDVEPNNTRSFANLITLSAPIIGKLGSAEDNDVYRFEVETAQPFVIALNRGSSSVEYHLELFFQSITPKHLIDQVSVFNTAQRELSLGLRAGTYFLKIRPYSEASIDINQFYSLVLEPYSGDLIEVESNNTQTTARSLKSNTPILGRLSHENDIDYYSFQMLGDEGDLEIYFETTSGSLDSKMMLLSETGRQTNLGTSDDGEDLMYKSGVRGGNHYIRLEVNKSSPSGGNFDPENFYTLRVEGASLRPIEKLESLLIQGATTVAIGEELPLSIEGTFVDGSQSELGDAVHWSTGNADIAIVNDNGTVTGLSSGKVTITATSVSQAEVQDSREIAVGSGEGEAIQDIGNAIIVSGGGAHSKNELWNATDYLSNHAYRTFKLRTFTDDEIFYLSPKPYQDLDGDGYDDEIVDLLISDKLTPKKLLQRMITWAIEQPSTGPLYIYLMDHGFENKFQILPEVILHQDDLKKELDRFRTETQRAVVLILEFCFAGTFLDIAEEASPSITVLTSTGDEFAYLSAEGAISYSQFFWENITKGATLEEAHNQAAEALGNQGRPYNRQHPDISGLSTNLTKSVGPDFKIAPIEVNFTRTPNSRSISEKKAYDFQVELSETGSESLVWFTVTPPTINEVNVTGEFYTPVGLLDKVTMTLNEDNQFEGSYQFTCNGTHHLNFYTLDEFGRVAASPPVEIQVSNHSDEACLSETSSNYLQIQPGWNLFGLQFGQDISASTFFSGVSEVVSVWTWEANQWKIWPSSYRQTLENQYDVDLEDFNTLKVNQGYWIQATDLVKIPLTTTAITSSPDLYEMGPGWHLVSFGDQTLPITELLQTRPQIHSIWTWSGSTWEVATSQGALADFPVLTTIHPSRGYWVRLLQE